MRIFRECKLDNIEPDLIGFMEDQNCDRFVLIKTEDITLKVRGEETYIECLSRYLLDYSMPKKLPKHKYYLLVRHNHRDIYILLDWIEDIGKNFNHGHREFFINFKKPGNVQISLSILAEKLNNKTELTNVFDYIFENIQQFDIDE